MKDKKRSYYKELKQPDEFVSFWNRATEYVLEHKRQFLLGTAGVLLVVVMVFTATLYLHSRERKAAVLLGLARASLDTVSALGVTPTDGTLRRSDPDSGAAEMEAVTELERIVDRYGRTPAGHQSRLLLGRIYYERGDYPTALEFYEGLAGLRGVTAEIRALAWEGLAYAYEGKGDLARAAAYHEKVAKGRVSYLRPWGWMGLARCYEGMGEGQRAVEAYNRFLSDFPHHSLAPEARALVSRIYARPAEPEVPAVPGEPLSSGNEAAEAAGDPGPGDVLPGG